LLNQVTTRLLNRKATPKLPESDRPPVRVAVLGAGKIAEKHLDTLAALDNVQLVGICNRGNSDLTPIAQKYAIQNTFSDWRKMLDTVQPDAAVILVSHFETVNVTAECLRRRIPSLIEKPAGFTSAETAQLADLADEYDCLNMVAVNRRYYSVVNAAIQAVKLHGPVMGVAIDAPEGIRNIRATSRHGAELIDNWLIANTIHAIDLFRHVGGEIDEVYAARHTWHDTKADSFSATLRYESGALGSFMAHWQSPSLGWKMTIYGDGILANLNPFEKGELRLMDRTAKPIPIAPADNLYKPGFYEQNRAFIDAVAYGERPAPPASDLRDAVKTMQLIEKIGGSNE
jgi:predicted dehydrogenase